MDAASARLPVSLHVRLPVPLVTRAARTQTVNRAGDDNKQVTPTILGIVGVLYVIIEILTGLVRIT